MSASRTQHPEEDGTDVEYITGRPRTSHIEQSNTRPDFSQKKIPDTPCAASVISFLLGGLFAISLSVVYSKLDGLLNPVEYLKPVHWWATSQNAFFFAAWSFFHIIYLYFHDFYLIHSKSITRYLYYFFTSPKSTRYTKLSITSDIQCNK